MDIFLTTVFLLPWLPSVLFASKMAAISSSSSVVLFDDIPVSLTRIGIWYCLSKHLPDKRKNKTDQHLHKLSKASNGITQMAIFFFHVTKQDATIIEAIDEKIVHECQ